jgi:hypothetical protein
LPLNDSGMTGSKITTLLCFFCITAQICFGQKSFTMHYRAIAHFDSNAFKKMADSISLGKAKEEGKDSIDAQARGLLDAFTVMFDSLSLSSMIEDSYVFREGDFVYKKREGFLLLKYDLTSLDFFTIDSVNYPITQKVDIKTYHYNDTSYRYKQTITDESKKIHGYDCKKLIVEEYDVERNETRILTIWATRDIKPALSIRAVCGLNKKIFEDYTPISFIEKGPWGFSEIEAINLNR